MHHKLYHLHARTVFWHRPWLDGLLCALLALVVVVNPVGASTRLEDRSLFMKSATPGDVTDYTVSFQYMTSAAVGSVDMEFCINPIPYMPCVTPPGLDVSNAILSDQTGETGYVIGQQSANHVVLSRIPQMITTFGGTSSYTLSGVKNPDVSNGAFSIRLKSMSGSDATGSMIDFGSVRGSATTDITIETQVPPMLIFCMAEKVEDDCRKTNNIRYKDMGSLDGKSTLTAQSQMAVGTNATGGFAITVAGPAMSAGLETIRSLEKPTPSQPGVEQFGINLVDNSAPNIGHNPEGEWTNAVVSGDYAQPNKFKYQEGDVIAYSDSVSLMRKYTVSYILNTPPSLRAGVYSTTINYIASGRF